MPLFALRARARLCAFVATLPTHGASAGLMRGEICEEIGLEIYIFDIWIHGEIGMDFVKFIKQFSKCIR